MVKTTDDRKTPERIYPYPFNDQKGIIQIKVLITVLNNVREKTFEKIYVFNFKGVTVILCSTPCCFSNKTRAPTNIKPRTDVSINIIPTAASSLIFIGTLSRIRMYNNPMIL